MPSKGDISRDLFDPDKGYTSVRSQQGRVTLDADRNENTDILVHDARTVRTDLIGAHGGPQDDAGLEILADGDQLRIGTGRYYVDGIRVDHRVPEDEAATDVAFVEQPFFPGPGGGLELPTTDGWYVAYVDVWERSITAIEDQHIREIALGGPDTTTREQVVWQVRLLPITVASVPACAAELPEWATLVAPSTATLAVRTVPGPVDTKPCVVPEKAGYRGLENQHYRFEVHSWGPGPSARIIKWSRENASVLAWLIDAPSGDTIQVERLGPGGTRGFAVGDWVEIRDDRDELAGRSGELFRINEVGADSLVLDGSPGFAYDPSWHPRVIRWDGVVVNPSPGDWVDIERGIQIRRTGAAEVGSYWLAPVRAAIDGMSDGQELDWPRDGVDPAALAPFGPPHHRAKLAIVQRAGDAWTVHDCRRLFPNLGDLLDLEVFGGDGQFTHPKHWLPRPIAVSLMRGGQPLTGESVDFEVTVGAGLLSDLAPLADGAIAPGATTGSQIRVQTDSRGIAWAWWRTGAATESETDTHGDRYRPGDGQEVEATLRFGNAPTEQRARFVAHTQGERRLDYYGGDGQTGLPGQTLKIALRVQVTQGARPVSGARVRFISRNRKLDGTNLDPKRGGALHASSNFVPGLEVRWPNSGQMLEAVVETDAHGVAQIQWRLGEELGLPTQRVEAVLLDDDNALTHHRVLFTAQLDLGQVLTRWLVQQSLGLPLEFGEARKQPLLAAEVIDHARVRLSYLEQALPNKVWKPVYRGMSITCNISKPRRFKFSLPFALPKFESIPYDLVRFEVIRNDDLIIVLPASLEVEDNQIDIFLDNASNTLQSLVAQGPRPARLRLLLSELYPYTDCMRTIEWAASFQLDVQQT